MRLGKVLGELPPHHRCGVVHKTHPSELIKRLSDLPTKCKAVKVGSIRKAGLAKTVSISKDATPSLKKGTTPPLKNAYLKRRGEMESIIPWLVGGGLLLLLLA